MSTAARVIECVECQLGLEKGQAKPESLLEDNLGADSLDRVEITMALEYEFDILVDDEKVDRCKTVADLIAMVESALAGKVEGSPV